MTSLARAERARLLDLLSAAGPDAPTLCGGWTTRELAAHLVVRERQPLSILGQLAAPLHPLSAWFERRQRDTPYDVLLAQLRSGPPAWSPVGNPIDRVYDATNLHEFFVHAEDVRRAGREQTPLTVSPALEDALWRQTGRLAPVFTRRARGARIDLVSPDGRSRRVRTGERPVVVRGRPAELFLWLWGRGAVADVHVEGELGGVAIGP